MRNLEMLSEEYKDSALRLLDRIKHIKSIHSKSEQVDNDLEKRLSILITEYYQALKISKYLKSYYNK